MSDVVILDINNVSKSFPGTLALDHVSLQIYKGEIHAICGENGAGKSTLMNILVGNYQPDSGRVIYEGNEIKQFSQRQMQNLGISIVYQERSLIPTLNVALNIFPDRQVRNKFGMIDRKKTYAKATEIMNSLQVDISPKEVVANLSLAMQQMVEIAKAISVDAKVIIFDEPTAALTENETQILFREIRRLKESGITIIYISHRLAEIFTIADRVSVLKDGCYICTRNVTETNIDDIVMHMVGRNIETFARDSQCSEDVLFEVENLSSKKFKNISFKVKKGEICTLTGLTGAGRTELALAILGADRRAAGSVKLEGKQLSLFNIKKNISIGIGYLPEDRKEQGLFLEMSILSNIVAGALDFFSNLGIFNNYRATQSAMGFKDMLNIVAPSIKKEVMLLSGGNQQKVLIAKWLMVKPKLLIMDEPTRGVDIGAKSEIYQHIRSFVETGNSVLVISSDMSEVLSISDRIIVMSDGRISGEMERGEFSEELILKYAARLI